MMTDDIVTRLRKINNRLEVSQLREVNHLKVADVQNSLTEAISEIERLREWKQVADMFGQCFRMDEFGQSLVSDGKDVFEATLAWERLRTKDARHD